MRALLVLCGYVLCTSVHPTVFAAQTLPLAGLAGACYDLSLGPWRPEPLRGEDSIYIAPPSRVRFDTVRSERRPSHFVLRAAPGALPSIHRYALWKVAITDSVELIWSTGYSGLRMTLGGGARELRGTARAFWDFPRDPLTAEAVARRVPCDTPSRPAATDQRFVLRAVPFADGDSVAVGMALTALRAQADSLRGRAFRARGVPAGPFAGAVTVKFSVNHRDTVWRIEATYPPDTEFDSLAERFTRLLGPPVSRSPIRLPSSGEITGARASWSNRTTSLTLHQTSLVGGGRSTTVTIVDPRVRL